MRRIVFISMVFTLVMLIFPGTGIYGEDAYCLNPYFSDDPSRPGSQPASRGAIPENSEVVFSSLEQDSDYEESQLRRFEIIFFISLPVSLLFSIAGVWTYRAASGESGNFTPLEYRYILLSAVAISFTIALHDNRIVFKKSGF